MADDDKGARGINSYAVRTGHGLMENEGSTVNLQENIEGDAE